MKRVNYKQTYFKYKPLKRKRVFKFEGHRLEMPADSNLVCLSQFTADKVIVSYMKVSNQDDPLTRIRGLGEQVFSSEYKSSLEEKLEEIGAVKINKK